jgi:hypothetical protein
VSRARGHFRQADLSRAIKAARAAGAERVEVDPSGRIVVHLKPHPGGVQDEESFENPWEKALARTTDGKD